MHLLGAIAAAVLLAACVPAGTRVSTPLGGVEVSHPPRPEMAGAGATCMVDGRLTLPAGASLDCSPPPAAAQPGAGAATRPSDPKGPLGEPGTHGFLVGTLPVDTPAPDPLLERIRQAEGGSNFAYCDPAGLHIGDGIKIHLSDAEREAAICTALEEARTEARRVLGEETWQELDQVRRDVWTELCYAAACAGFRDTAHLTRVGAYVAAALELLDSTCPTCLYTRNPARAELLAKWLRTGVRD